MSTLTAPQDVAEADVQAGVQPELSEEERKMWDYYEQEVIRGLESGPPIPFTPEFLVKIREEVEQRLQAKRAGKTA